MVKKKLNVQKEQFRGIIKQLMKVRGLRTISIANYSKWKGEEIDDNSVHSIKFGIQDGYINIYGCKKGKNGTLLCGNIIDHATAEQYQEVYDKVIEILDSESSIPHKIRRNILVQICR